MHGIAVHVKKGLSFARDSSLENSADSYLCFQLALLHSVSLTSFSFIDGRFTSFDVLSINPSASLFVFATI